MSGISTKMLQAAAGAKAVNDYIAVSKGSSTNGFMLLSHNSGSLSFAATYNIQTLSNAFSPDDNYIASGSNFGTITLLDHTTPGSVSLAATYSLADFSQVHDVSFSSDGNYLGAAHFVSPYFTLLDHTTPGTLSLSATYVLPGNGRGVSFSSLGGIATAHANGPFTLLDDTTPGVLTLSTTYFVGGPNNNGFSTEFSRSGDYVAVGLNGAPRFLLLTSSGNLSSTYTLPATGFDIAFSPDDNYIAVAHSGSPYFTLLDHTTPGSVSLAATYTLPGPECFSTSFSPSGDYIAIGHRNPNSDDIGFTLLDHTTPGSVSLAATYVIAGFASIVNKVRFTNTEQL